MTPLGLMLGLAGGLGFLGHLFVAAPFTLPDSKHCVRIARALIDRAVRWDDLAATSRAGSSACRAPFHIDSQRIVVGHKSIETVVRGQWLVVSSQ
jgi:hypothetical protein